MTAQWPAYGDQAFNSLRTSDVFTRASMRAKYSEPALRHMAITCWFESRHKPGWTHVEYSDDGSGWRLVHGLPQFYQGTGSSTFPEIMLAYNEADSDAFADIMGPHAQDLLSSSVRQKRFDSPDLPERFRQLGEYEGFDEIQVAVMYKYYYAPLARAIQRLGLSWDVGYAMCFDRAIVWGWGRAERDLDSVYNAHYSSGGEAAVWAAYKRLDDDASLQKRRQWIWDGDPIYGRAIDATHAPVKVDPLGQSSDSSSGGSDGGGGVGGFRGGSDSGQSAGDRAVLSDELLYQELAKIGESLERMGDGIERLLDLYYSS